MRQVIANRLFLKPRLNNFKISKAKKNSCVFRCAMLIFWKSHSVNAFFLKKLGKQQILKIQPLGTFRNLLNTMNIIFYDQCFLIAKSNLKMFCQFWKNTTVSNIGSCHSVTSRHDRWGISPLNIQFFGSNGTKGR